MRARHFRALALLLFRFDEGSIAPHQVFFAFGCGFAFDADKGGHRCSPSVQETAFVPILRLRRLSNSGHLRPWLPALARSELQIWRSSFARDLPPLGGKSLALRYCFYAFDAVTRKTVRSPILPFAKNRRHWHRSGYSSPGTSKPSSENQAGFEQVDLCFEVIPSRRKHNHAKCSGEAGDGLPRLIQTAWQTHGIFVRNCTPSSKCGFIARARK